MKRTRNRLMELQLDFRIKKNKDFAQMCGLSETLYSRYINHLDEPGRDQLWSIWENLKTYKPEIHLEELLEKAPE